MFRGTILYILLATAGLVFRASHPGFKQLLELFIASVVISIVFLLSKLIIAACLWRRLIVLHSDVRSDFVGKPLLFPARLSHARRFPQIERYNYWYDYFMVGVPVGLRGRIGNLLSIDNLPAQEHSREKCWFTIDPAYYLDPGSGDRSLQEKLYLFLRSRGENPQEFPYAYLISVPRFLWWQKSAISYWYLYSSERKLTAMIMEINNSFYEKRNIFFPLTGDGIAVDSPQPQATTITATKKATKEPVSIRFQYSTSQSKHYKGSWEKLIFGSPFEKVGGSMTAKFVDPMLGPSLQSNLSSNTPDGQVKVTSRLASWGEPVDPLLSDSWSVARFVARWTHVGALSAPRIVKEALRIRFRGNLQYLQRPEVRADSVPRKQTKVERTMELFFREYLSQLAAHCLFPISIRYTPPKWLHFESITFHSPMTPTSCPRPVLTITPLTPRFYASFPEHSNAVEAFSAETTASLTNADPNSRRLEVSDSTLLDQVLSTAAQFLDREGEKTTVQSSKPAHRWFECKLLEAIIARLRGSRSTTFMDRFVLSHFPAAKDQLAYQRNILRWHLARRLPIESQAIVTLCFIAVRTAIVGIVLRCAYSVWAETEVVRWLVDTANITPDIGALAYGGWEMVTGYIGEYYLNPFAWGEGL
ncbi:hypothetical protein BJX96DRAFT_167030 [Aspergillus floccosus]